MVLDDFEVAAIGALRAAEDALRNTVIGPELAAHGWSTPFAVGLADYCARLRSDVENRRYDVSWGSAGLVRWMQEDVSPLRKDMDLLREAVHNASRALQTLSELLSQSPH
jgi:hypothetical protein